MSIKQKIDNIKEELGPKKVAVIKEIFSWLLTMGVVYLIVLVLTTFLVVNANIPSESMEKTIMTGDKLFANRLAYINSDPERGDIVVFNATVEDTLYIKRIIGLPGEKVEIRDAKIYINDSTEPLEEDYLPEPWYHKNDGLVYQVPEGCYFMLGDNRNHSSDSREWKDIAMSRPLNKTEEEAEQYQFVKRSEILGKAFFRYWPLNKMKIID